jgi:energy-coupling factor transporter ATP-binding protein EcfA2
MLKKLEINNFTSFRHLTGDCSPNINVIIGENSAGKSHLIKLIYSMLATSFDAGRKDIDSSPTKNSLSRAYAEKFLGVFRPEKLGRLVRRKQGRDRCNISLQFDQSNLDCSLSFATNASTEVQVDQLPSSWERQSPLFFPTRELMTIFPGFVSLFEGRYLEFEETWKDICVFLGAPPLKGPRDDRVKSLLDPIEEAMGGKVVLENGRFYLKIPGSGNMEMHLVAEGLRKISMLARLISNGTIHDQGYLFWDEPEANLNPKLIKLIANILCNLAKKGGIQIFIATHSYFLMKELEIVSKNGALPIKFWGLNKSMKDGEENEVSVKIGNSLGDLDNITSLDEEIAQYDRNVG